MTLKPSEISFWQAVYLEAIRTPNGYQPSYRADVAINNLRERIEEPGPRLDGGRL